MKHWIIGGTVAIAATVLLFRSRTAPDQTIPTPTTTTAAPIRPALARDPSTAATAPAAARPDLDDATPATTPAAATP